MNPKGEAMLILSKKPTEDDGDGGSAKAPDCADLGNEMIDAIKSGDGQGVYDAIKAMVGMAGEPYGDKNEDYEG